MFLVEAHQAAIFQVRNLPKESLDPVLSITCPNILFPYARETVSDAITRCGFPPFLLAPVNFEALYQQRSAAARPRRSRAHYPLKRVAAGAEPSASDTRSTGQA